MPGPAPKTPEDPRTERWPGRARSRDISRLRYIEAIFGIRGSAALSRAIAIAYRAAQTEAVRRVARLNGIDYGEAALLLGEQKLREEHGVDAWLKTSPLPP